jgi:hypothetical protein
MGYRVADQYSLLHASVGVFAYFWSIPFILSVIIHTIFEIVENSATGIHYIQKYFIGSGIFKWPGGKREPDAIINRIGDTVFFAGGWLLASWLNRVGTERAWYYPSK